MGGSQKGEVAMRVEKEKRKVSIVCKDGSLITGIVHINPGERMLDFLNDQKETFIPITESEVCNTSSTEPKLICKKVNTIILSKSSIKFVEEL